MAPDKLDATNATAKSTIPGKTAARVVREKLLAIHGVRARIALLEDIKVRFFLIIFFNYHFFRFRSQPNPQLIFLSCSFFLLSSTNNNINKTT